MFKFFSHCRCDSLRIFLSWTQYTEYTYSVHSCIFMYGAKILSARQGGSSQWNEWNNTHTHFDPHVSIKTFSSLYREFHLAQGKKKGADRTLCKFCLLLACVFSFSNHNLVRLGAHGFFFFHFSEGWEGQSWTPSSFETF